MHELLQSLTRVPEVAGARVERKLSSGPLSDKWLLVSDSGQWVLRKDKPLAARLQLDRVGELEVIAALATIGWCSNVVWSDLQQGLLLTSFVPGRVWTDADMRQSNQIGRVALLLCRLHKIPERVPAFRLSDRVNRYAECLGTQAAAECADNICQLLMETGASKSIAICHNDPVASNIVDDGELHLIDFEFAAAGDPLFDLAALIEYHQLPPAKVEQLADAYRRAGGSCERQLLEQWRIIYSQTASLWNQVIKSI